MRAVLRLKSAPASFVAAAILVVTLTHSRAESMDLVVTDQDNGRTVAAVVQQSILIQLRGNASTGYTWILTGTNGNSLSATGLATYVPDGGAPGSGGLFSLPFLATTPGQTTLSFSYEKPWEPGNAAQTFMVTIDVAEPQWPRLSVVLKGNNAVVSWPMAGSSGFYLEGTRTISSGWAVLNAAVIPDGLNYTVTLPASGQSLFCRLRR